VNRSPNNVLADDALNPADSIWHGRAHDFILPRLVELPAGEFIMGENADDKFANDTERPAHRVAIEEGLAFGCFPVTVGEFRKFRPAHAPGEPDEWPVVCVNWSDASGYCEWLGKLFGRNFRLPSEAEWEFACRAGSHTPFAAGNELTSAEANFLYDENGIQIGRGRRVAVGSYPPNDFGLFDLHGNVSEWLADSWHPNYIDAPADGRAWVESGDDRHVIRGGAWDYLPRLLRSSWRDWRRADCHADNIGFRLVSDGGKIGNRI